MQLTVQQARALLAKHGVYACEICEKCGMVLGAIRFTRKCEAGEWCSRECRGDVQRDAIRKGGRPRKHRTEAARIGAERHQNAERQRTFRVRLQRNGKPPRTLAETNDLQAQKAPLSTIPLTRSISARKQAFSEFGGVRA